MFYNSQDPDKYGKIPNRIIGQVWDSVTHPSYAIVAIPLAYFPNSKFMQSLTRGLFWFYSKLFKSLWNLISDGIDNFCDDLARAPALIFSSKVDNIGTCQFAEEVVRRWRANGVDVTYKCFPDSEHVKHFKKYPEEYLCLLHNHWKLVKLLERK